jgi:excisionase family DNA binding protein
MNELHPSDVTNVSSLSALTSIESIRRSRLDSLVADLPDIFRLPALSPAVCATPRAIESEYHPSPVLPRPSQNQRPTVDRPLEPLSRPRAASASVHPKLAPERRFTAAQEIIPDVMTGQEAADYLRIGLRTLREWTRGRGIPHAHIGRSIRYRRAALLEWLAAQETV